MAVGAGPAKLLLKELLSRDLTVTLAHSHRKRRGQATPFFPFSILLGL